jgi:predicted lipoprotein with Yx(FWY)xxD motif
LYALKASTDADPATNRRCNRRHRSGLSGRLLLLYPEEKNMRILFALATAVTTVATVAFAQMAPTKTGDSAKGKVLTNDKGMTLYIFDKDSSGKSACNGPCAGNWPPLTAAADAMQMGRLPRHHARRWQQAVGLQRPPALYLERRQEAGRHHRRWFRQRRLAHCSTVV